MRIYEEEEKIVKVVMHLLKDGNLIGRHQLVRDVQVVLNNTIYDSVIDNTISKMINLEYIIGVKRNETLRILSNYTHEFI